MLALDRRRFFRSAAAGNADAVQDMLSQGMGVEARSILGRTAIMFAALNGREDVIALLLRAGASVNVRTRFGSSTALIYAIDKNHVETVRALLKGGASVTDLVGGQTALQRAVLKGNTDIVQLLLEHGANPYPEIAVGSSAQPLIMGAERGHLTIVQLLLKAGARIDGQSPSGDALAAAKRGKHTQVVQALIAAGASEVDELAAAITRTELRELTDEKTLACLPHWALVAFAARCCRRALPVYKDYAVRRSLPNQYLGAVQIAIDAAEHAATSGSLPADLKMIVENAVKASEADDEMKQAEARYRATGRAYPAFFALDCAKASARVAELIATDVFRPGLAAIALTSYADAACGLFGGSISPSVLIANTRDFQLLRKEATAGNWSDDTPVPKELMGPLWPQGYPKGWPPQFAE